MQATPVPSRGVVALLVGQALVGIDRRALEHVCHARHPQRLVGPPRRRVVVEHRVDHHEQPALTAQRRRRRAPLDEDVLGEGVPQHVRVRRSSGVGGVLGIPLLQKRECGIRLVVAGGDLGIRGRQSHADEREVVWLDGVEVVGRQRSLGDRALDELVDAGGAPAVVPGARERVRVVLRDDRVVRRDDVALGGVVRDGAGSRCCRRRPRRRGSARARRTARRRRGSRRSPSPCLRAKMADAVVPGCRAVQRRLTAFSPSGAPVGGTTVPVPVPV